MNRLNPGLTSDMQTTEDVFLGDRLIIRQPANGYRAGIDAVLLAACARAGESPILDIGAGVGTVALCAAARLADVRVVLVEREPELAALARANVTTAGFGARVSVVEADIGEPLSADTSRALPPDVFAHVLANPPFHEEGAGTRSHWPLKAVAHAMGPESLELWARFMARMTMPGGRATMIHKADALPRILSAFENRFGALTILPIYPREGAPAIRVLVDGVKGSRAPLTLKPGLVLHGDSNAFRPDVERILRHGAALQI